MKNFKHVSVFVALLVAAGLIASCTPEVDIGEVWDSTITITNCPGGEIKEIFVIESMTAQTGIAYNEYNIYAKGINSVTMIAKPGEGLFTRGGRHLVTAVHGGTQYVWLSVKFTNGGAVIDWGTKMKAP
jgi:hypothetical protein